MEPTKNKTADIAPNLSQDWPALALFLDKVALDNLKNASAGSAAHILAQRLRAVADYARDPWNEAKLNPTK